MKVLAISDLHGRLPEIDDCDVLLIAGDICPDHPVGKRQRYNLPDQGSGWQANWLDTEFRAWLEALTQRKIQVVAIWGNHDFVGEHPGLWPQDLPWTLLQDSEVQIGGLRIWGTPWVPGLKRWAFYASPEALRARADGIPRGIHVLMSHGPIYGVADFVAPQFGSTHVGDVPLALELPRINPIVMVCGHIHEQAGVHVSDTGVPIYNVSHCDEHYSEFVRPPWDLTERRAPLHGIV